MEKGGEEGRDYIYIYLGGGGKRAGREVWERKSRGHRVYNIVAPISRMMSEQQQRTG